MMRPTAKVGACAALGVALVACGWALGVWAEGGPPWRLSLGLGVVGLTALGAGFWLRGRVDRGPADSPPGRSSEGQPRQPGPQSLARGEAIGELALLSTLGGDLNRDLSLRHTVNAALQGLMRALGPDLTFICLREEKGLALRDLQTASHDPAPPGARQVGQAVCELVDRQGRALFCRDAPGQLPAIARHCREAGIQSLAAMPLRSGEEIIGTLGLAARQPRDFGVQAGLLEILASQVAAAIANARLFETLQQELLQRQDTLRQLRESQDRFRAISDQSPLAISLVDQDGRYQYLNPAFVAMFGYDLSDLRTRADWFRMAYPDPQHRREVMEHWEEDLALIKREGMVERTLRITTKAGVAKSILLRVVGIESGGAFILYEDISERLRAEQALRESELRFRRFIEGLPIAVAVVAADGTVEYLNQKFSQTLGYDRRDVPNLERWWRLAYPDPDYRQEVIEAWTSRVEAAHRANSEVEPLERRVRCKDGADRMVAFFGSPVQDKTLVVLHDVTEQRRAGLALAESEARFRRFVEASPVGIHMYHLEEPDRLVLTGYNPAADRILGIDHQPLVGLSIQEAFPELTEREVPDHYLRVARHGQIWRNEEVVYERDRVARAYEVLAFQTTPGNLAVIFHDIAERLRAEEELRLLERQLARAQRLEALGTLASGVAHDFNNILQALTGRVDLMVRDRSLSETTRGHIDNMRRSIMRAGDLVARMLSVSRAGEARLATLDLNREIASLVEMLGHALPRMVRIRTDLAPDLAPILGDANRLEQAVLNLATNARDAMPEGGELIFTTRNRRLDQAAARAAGLSPGDYVTLQVSDTGQGMDEVTMGRIFEPFFSTKAPGQGTGLGLYSVYGIIKEHHGVVTCHSQPGGGATFTMYFPQATAAPEPDQEQAQACAPAAGGEQTLLLVDDEPEILAFYSEALAAQGYQVLQAATGEEALRRLDEPGRRVDLIVMDLNMPGMGGEKALRLIRERHPSVCIIVASGYHDRRLKSSVLAAGAQQFLAKPFDFARLLAVIRQVLGEAASAPPA